MMTSDETNLNSLKLDIEGARQSLAAAGDSNKEFKESYKPIPDRDHQTVAEHLNNMVQDKKENNFEADDDASEMMLNEHKDNDKEKLDKKVHAEEVKFITGDHQNGDAKIDIGHTDNTFTGMTKDELMKFANDPFWVRTRWIFFILFWALWVGMLAGAILIIYNAPKCSAPIKLSWYRNGPILDVKKSVFDPQDLNAAKAARAMGVIYTLDGDNTYNVAHRDAEIKKITSNYADTDIKVILDMTPNYDKLTQAELVARTAADETLKSSYVWMQQSEVPNNWLNVNSNGSAWVQVSPGNFVLNQFGDNRFDLQMNEPQVKKRFKETLESLIKLGVSGFRLKNTKHFIVSSVRRDDEPKKEAGSVLTDYDFWTHSYTTFQDGLGDLLNEYREFVHNKTDNNGFLSVSDNLVRPEVYKIKGASDTLGVDIPIYGMLTHTIEQDGSANQILIELNQIRTNLGETNFWPQWVFNAPMNSKMGLSEYNIFVLLLPGVPVSTYEAFNFNNETLEVLDIIRESASFQHGTFEAFIDDKGLTVAYTRIKAGNPGFFVALNPTNEHVVANYEAVATLPDQMTVHTLSTNYNVSGIEVKNKIPTSEMPISPYSAMILTYVPK